MYTYIEIVSYETGKPIKRYDVTGKSERMRDRVDSGINRNLDTENYYTREQEYQQRQTKSPKNN